MGENCEDVQKKGTGITNLLCCGTDLCNKPSLTCRTGTSSTPGAEHSFPDNTVCGKYDFDGVTYYFGGYSQENCEDVQKKGTGITNLLCCGTDLCNKPSLTCHTGTSSTPG